MGPLTLSLSLLLNRGLLLVTRVSSKIETVVAVFYKTLSCLTGKIKNFQSQDEVCKE